MHHHTDRTLNKTTTAPVPRTPAQREAILQQCLQAQRAVKQWGDRLQLLRHALRDSLLDDASTVVPTRAPPVPARKSRRSAPSPARPEVAAGPHHEWMSAATGVRVTVRSHTSWTVRTRDLPRHIQEQYGRPRTYQTVRIASVAPRPHEDAEPDASPSSSDSDEAHPRPGRRGTPRR